MNSEDNLQLLTAHRQFSDYLISQQKAKATIIAYSKDIEQLVAFLSDMGKKSVMQIERDDLEAFLKKLSTDGYTLKSLSRKINSIKTFYRFLKYKNFISINPAADIAHPKYNIKPPRILSKMEYRALRDACRSDIRTYTIVELFLQTGVRIGELANLKINNIKEKEIIIDAQEGHPERSVPLNKAAKDSLDKWLQVRPKSEDQSLFITKTGKPLLVRNIRTTVVRIFLTKRGLPVLVIKSDWSSDLGLTCSHLSKESLAALFKGTLLSGCPSCASIIISFSLMLLIFKLANSPIRTPVCRNSSTMV